MGISIKQAVIAGKTKLRREIWSNKKDHIEITIVKNPDTGENCLGPWAKFWSPLNKIIDQPDPVKMLITQIGNLDDICWDVYEEEI